MEDLRYPIGRFTFPEEVRPGERQPWIAQIAEAPGKLRAAVAGLGPDQLDTSVNAHNAFALGLRTGPAAGASVR